MDLITPGSMLICEKTSRLVTGSRLTIEPRGRSRSKEKTRLTIIPENEGTEKDRGSSRVIMGKDPYQGHYYLHVAEWNHPNG
jgi:hypothetical protein